jgi:hypothetical protein
VFISCDFRVHGQGLLAMSNIGGRVVRSGVYAFLALAFVLACSLLMPAEQAGTQMASRYHPTDLPAYSGSARYTVPEPGAGDE